MGQKGVHGILTGQTTGRAQPLVQLDLQTIQLKETSVSRLIQGAGNLVQCLLWQPQHLGSPPKHQRDIAARAGKKKPLDKTKTCRGWPVASSAGRRSSLQADATPGLSLAQLARKPKQSFSKWNQPSLDKLQFCRDFIGLTNASPPKS